MKRKLMLLLTCLFVGIGLVTAQTQTVTGTVISEEDGQPVVGASVLVKGTTLGTITDIDGNFSISNVPSSAKTLQVSYIGMVTKEVSIQSGRMNINLASDTKLLDEVVVTAMGIRKSEKILGYAASTVKNEEILAARSGSVMGGLTGKVAGVSISNSGSAGASQKVIVRGYSSFNSNSPLFVIDGVPMLNEYSGSNVASSSNTVDFGNGGNDINPDDVESVTVLKGASATALYGSRAANGVIMITTKRAGLEKLSVSYDGSFSATNVLRVPQTQDKFGQGWPYWDRSENGSWGPALDGRMNEWGSDKLAEPMVKPFSYVEDNMRNFFVTGFESNQNISARYGNENLGLVVSYGNVTSNGVLPCDADKYARNTFSFRGNMKSGRFAAEANINYVRKDMTKAAAGQGDDGSTMMQEIIQHAVDIDMSAMKNYNDERYNADNFYTWYAQNPYWVLDNNRNTYQDDRIFGKLEMSYELFPWLKAIGRLGGDFTNSKLEYKNAKLQYTTGSYSDGYKNEEAGAYYHSRTKNGQIDATAMLTGNYDINQDFNIGGSLGWNLNQRTYEYLYGYIYGLNVPGWYDMTNGSSTPEVYNYTQKRRTIGLFGQIELGYKNFWYVNLSGRNDWSSTLPVGKNSFFYGGVNTSLILTEIFPTLKDNQVDFLKVRAAIGQTGNDAGVYRTSSYFVPTQAPGYSGSLYTPLNGAAGLTEFNRLPNTDLKPEITTEWELGVSGNFFDNRISVDFAYYDKLTKDQIIAATLAPETRYTSATRNIGKISNRGIELAMNFVPVRTRDFTWELGGTFTKNWSKVKELWSINGKPVTEYIVASAYDVNLVAKVGEPLGVFQVPAKATVKDKNSPYYGYTLVDNMGCTYSDTSEKTTLGSSNPDFVAGFNTKFKYKNWTLSMVADWHKGGYFYSYTSQLMHFNGNATPTVFNDRQAFLVPHSARLVNGEYVENTIPVTNTNMYLFYNDSYGNNWDRFVLKKDFVKLREIVLTYTFPKSLISKLHLSQLDLSFIGRNLFMWTPKENNYVDPESSNYGNDIRSEFGEFATLPTTRNIGGSIKVVF